jgi:predicted RNA-binding Zn-ribbon protein involved in translation (DUF1610 family)
VSVAEPSVPRCAACGVELVPAHTGGARLLVGPLGVTRRTAAEPHVCPRCGRVDYFVVDLAPFRERPPAS